MLMPSITLRHLFEAKIHLGHLTRFREPKMTPFIYGVKNRMHVLNLEHTLSYLAKAMQFASRLAARPGSKLLFVGTKRAAQAAMQAQAIRAGMPYVSRHWPGGMLTNYRTLRQSVKRLKELEMMSEEGDLKSLTKKEALGIKRKRAKLERDVGGIKEMSGLPDALFVIDIGYEYIAVSEAKKLKIPIIGVVDTNHSPEGIDYVIPGNDDATSAIQVYATLIADAVLAGRSPPNLSPATPASQVPEVPTESEA
jgi:small subunit ribosomal protein S2